MKIPSKTKVNLDKMFQKVLETPASFDFYIAIHDFVECIEKNAPLSRNLSQNSKINQDSNMAGKYNYLKQIYQGIEDIRSSSKSDLGHARYSVIRELHGIERRDVSDSNSFWKKRELFRKLAGEIHSRLSAVSGGLAAVK